MMPENRVIVNCAIGGHYPGLQDVLTKACREHCNGTQRLFYRDKYPAGCPRHERQMYGFKIYALKEAIASGVRLALWLDCTFRPRAPLQSVWDEIEREGWYIPPQLDARLGRWCSDAALSMFGIDRTTAMMIPLVYSGVVGLNVQHAIGHTIWELWKNLYERGSFNGAHKAKMGAPLTPWGNKWEGHVSDDPTIEGHRHDEAALSFILWKLGLTPPRRGFLTVEDPAGCIERNFL